MAPSTTKKLSSFFEKLQLKLFREYGELELPLKTSNYNSVYYYVYWCEVQHVAKSHTIGNAAVFYTTTVVFKFLSTRIMIS